MATSITLTALANLLNDYRQTYIGKADYLKLLGVYSRSHTRLREDGIIVPWIDENLNPYDGDWISRTCLKNWKDGTWSKEMGGVERGKDYNHSTFCDLVITGLVGLRASANDSLTVNPLLLDEIWDYFYLDNVAYHGRTLTILYDKTGDIYHRGKGLKVFANGIKIAGSGNLQNIDFMLK